MTHRSLLSGAESRTGPAEDLPAPELVAFIRYCHQRHGASWPELYDEMCAVAARREYLGWDHDQLAARGLTFSLFEMPRLAGWARAVLAGVAEQLEADTKRNKPSPRTEPQGAVA